MRRGVLAGLLASTTALHRFPFSSMAATLPPGTLVVQPTQKHTASLIMLHGLGDSSEGWIDVAEELAPRLPHVKFILPTASTKPVSLNNGMSMPSWYDIKGLGPRSKETCEGLDESTDVVRQILAEEFEAGIPMSRIVLGGFSQGGAMSLWVPEPSKNTPVLFCHGTADPVVQYPWGKMSEKAVRDRGVKNVEFKSYEGMGHSACPEEINDVFAFVARVLPATSAKT